MYILPSYSSNLKQLLKIKVRGRGKGRGAEGRNDPNNVCTCE
jgi:hypothetical protein